MPTALIAKCRHVACARSVTCAHFREVVTDPNLPEISAPRQGHEGCQEYIQIGSRAGRELTPWTSTSRPLPSTKKQHGPDLFSPAFTRPKFTS